MALCYTQRKHIIFVIICIICPLLCFGFVPSIGRTRDYTAQTQHMHKNFALPASSSDDTTGSSTSKSARERGIYSRPSAAIERGSGFFIPGLEGSRIRLIFGITCLVANAANHNFLVDSMPGDWGQSVAEIIAALYGTLLVLQGSIEAGVERGAMQNEAVIISGSSEDGVINLNRRDGSSSRIADALQNDDITLKTIQRMSQIIMSFTPATCFQFVTEDFGVIYSVGVGGENTATNDDNEEKRMTKLSLDAVAGSKGGRVALPSDHPASKLLPESATRCILVQKVSEYQGSRACMIIGSDKLLPSFTKNDLRWIGQLAEYNTVMSA